MFISGLCIFWDTVFGTVISFLPFCFVFFCTHRHTQTLLRWHAGHRAQVMLYTKGKSHITQHDSPLREANEGELCDQFRMLWRSFGLLHTDTVIQQLTPTTQCDWPTNNLQVPIYNHGIRGCHQLPQKFPCSAKRFDSKDRKRRCTDEQSLDIIYGCVTRNCRVKQRSDLVIWPLCSQSTSPNASQDPITVLRSVSN